jgi:hypothetical protein
MAGSTLKLIVDRQNKRLVGAVAQIPALFQSNTVGLIVQVVDPAPTTLQAPTIVDLNGKGLRASVGSQPTGSSGGPTPLALQDTFTWDATNNWFYADLALNTTDVNNHIGTLASRQAWFELNIVDGGDRTTILQNTFPLTAVVDELTSLVPTPTDVYLPKSEILALLAAKLDKVMRSPSGTWARELGIDDTGVKTDDSYQL